MKITDRILGYLGLIRKAVATIPLISSIGGGDPFALWQGQKKVAAEKALAIYSGWVYACVRAIAEELGKIEFRLFRVAADESTEELKEHELLDLLSGVNPHMTKFDLMFTTAAHLELTGNSYWYLEGIQKEGDAPTAIYPLNPKYIRPLKASVPEFLKGYEYQLGENKQTFAPYQILHFKYPDPSDPYEGIGTVAGIIDWINADNYASQVNLNYFKNGARLAGLLESAVYNTPEQLDYIKKSFAQVYAGAQNSYQIATIPEGVKFTQMSDNPKDMDFYNLQQVMRDKILAGFRVSKTILGTAESETNRATAETADYVFAARTIKPKMQMIVEYLNEFLVPRYGADLFLDFVDPVPQNRELDIQEMAAATGNQPILSPNEARERYFGEGPIEGGESVRGSAIIQPIGAPVEQPKKANRLATRTNGKPSTRFAKNAKARKGMASEIAKAAASALAATRENADAAKEKGIAGLSDGEYEPIYKVFALRVTPYKNALKEKIDDFNFAQKLKVLENLPNAIKKLKAVDPADLLDRQFFVSAMIDLSTPILTDLYGKEGEAAAELIGAGKIDVLTPEVRRAINDSIDLMSNSYNDTTLDALKATLEEGLSKGETFDELKDRVGQIYGQEAENRAEQTAVTETFRIANDATKEAWKQTGTVKSLKWYTAEDERVCPWCAPLQGKVVSIDENFFDKGDAVTSSDGKTLSLDYSDVGAPPLHPSCRCYIRPEEISLAQPPADEKTEEPARPSIEEVVKAEVEKKTAEIKEAAEKEIEKIRKSADEKVEALAKEVNEVLGQ